MTEPPDNAGVRIPPPLFYAVAILLGLLFDGVHSLPIVTPVATGVVRSVDVGSGFSRIALSRIILVVAWLLVAGWLYLTSTAFRLFWSKHTSVLPIRPSTTLVVAGPYRFTRNPMYLGLALLTIALSLFLNTWWPIVLLVPTLVVIQNFVIAREESYLHRRFGAEYDAYACQVRRWF
jgi:protein-S-isoprenylcysteine O-methyltransferase Ste14